MYRRSGGSQGRRQGGPDGTSGYHGQGRLPGGFPGGFAGASHQGRFTVPGRESSLALALTGHQGRVTLTGCEGGFTVPGGESRFAIPVALTSGRRSDVHRSRLQL